MTPVGFLLVRFAFAATVATIAALAPTHVLGQGIPGYPTILALDPREVAMLPRYCIHTQHFRDKVPGGNNAEEVKRWYSVMGDTFHHMHHYCFGVMSFNRATILARDAPTRRHYLGNAILEFDYVLREAPQSFILLPEILTKKGEVLVRQGRGAVAVEQFERAAELKPDYWPPYAHLSDYYKESGDRIKARELLQKGLSFAPDARGLRRRLEALDRESRGGRDATPAAAK
jgi:hypothetical protein